MAEECVYWNTPEGVFAYDNADGFEDEDVLGKPITLAVVLMAIRQSGNFWFGFKLREAQESILEDWNLSKDNFNDQSDETKKFIGGLLGIKYT